MGLEDRHGYLLGTRTAAAAAAYHDGLDRFLALSGDAEEPLRRAVQLDPDFAHGWTTLAALHHFNGDRVATRTCLSRARSSAENATHRELGYLKVLETAETARVAHTLVLAEHHLASFPRDVLVVEQVMLSSHFGGGSSVDRANALRILRANEPTMGDDWAFLGVSAFVHQEADQLDDALRLAQRSLRSKPSNADAMHAVAHVHYERGAHATGRDELATWVTEHGIGGPFHVHFSWHLALHDLGLGQWSMALDRYRNIISPRVSGPGTISDAPTLLWRLMLSGHNPADLAWDELVEVAGPMAATPTFRYGDWHVAFALAGGRSNAQLEELEAALVEHSDGRPQAPTMVRVVRGLQCHVKGDHAGASDFLDIGADDLPYLGGSRAQREVIEDTLIDSLLKCDRSNRARELLESRLARRPSHSDETLLASCR